MTRLRNVECLVVSLKWLWWDRRKEKEVLFIPVKCAMRNEGKHLVSPIILPLEEIRGRDSGSGQQTNGKEDSIKYCQYTP